jgi:hypothetical protein
MGSVRKISEGVRVDKLRRNSLFVTQRRRVRKRLKERIPQGGGIDGQDSSGRLAKTRRPSDPGEVVRDLA